MKNVHDTKPAAERVGNSTQQRLWQHGGHYPHCSGVLDTRTCVYDRPLNTTLSSGSAFPVPAMHTHTHTHSPAPPSDRMH